MRRDRRLGFCIDGVIEFPLHLPVRHFAVHEHLAVGLDIGQRRKQFMGHMGNELLLRLLGHLGGGNVADS